MSQSLLMSMSNQINRGVGTKRAEGQPQHQYFSGAAEATENWVGKTYKSMSVALQ